MLASPSEVRSRNSRPDRWLMKSSLVREREDQVQHR
jgi:hypothetical protein